MFKQLLIRVSKWYNKVGLTINPAKTNCIFCTKTVDGTQWHQDGVSRDKFPGPVKD